MNSTAERLAGLPRSVEHPRPHFLILDGITQEALKQRQALRYTRQFERNCELYRLWCEGKTTRELAERFGVNLSRVSQIVNDMHSQITRHRANHQIMEGVLRKFAS